MLIVPDVQDVYIPLETDVIVQLSEVGFSDFMFLTHNTDTHTQDVMLFYGFGGALKCETNNELFIS